MAKVKYYYDPKTLSYRKIEPSNGYVARITLLIAFSILVLMFVGFIVFSQFVKKPSELADDRE